MDGEFSFLSINSMLTLGSRVPLSLFPERREGEMNRWNEWMSLKRWKARHKPTVGLTSSLHPPLCPERDEVRPRGGTRRVPHRETVAFFISFLYSKDLMSHDIFSAFFTFLRSLLSLGVRSALTYLALRAHCVQSETDNAMPRLKATNGLKAKDLFWWRLTSLLTPLRSWK